MRAVVYRGRDDLRLEEIPIPEPQAGEMIVRVDACGICPTDLKKVEKGLLSGPRVFGHEIAGTVAALGRGTQGFAEGDRVVVHHHVPCRRCYYCERRVYAQCPRAKENGTTAGFTPSGGGYSEFVLARDWVVAEGTVRIPDGVLAMEAALVEPVNTCLKAVVKTGAGPGDTVLVVGQGPIGLLLMQLLRHAGAMVVVSDPVARRREASLRLGAEVALEPGPGVAETVKARTQGRGVDLAFVAAVGASALGQAIDATRPGGAVLSFAATSPGETAEVDLGVMTASEKDLLTSYGSSIDLQERAAELVFTRAVRTQELVTHALPMGEALRAFAIARRPDEGTLKVVLTPGAGRA